MLEPKVKQFVETPMTQSLIDRLRIFGSLLGFVKPLLPSKPKVIDLACGHCLFLQAAQRLGCNVVGVDARLDRVPIDIPEALPVIQQKVQDADLRPFDLVLCLGIFYHLTFEDQIALIGKFSGKIVVVDTHYCVGNAPVTRSDSGNCYAGSLFAEGEGLTSSFGNRNSFWPIESDLVRMLGRGHNVMKWLPEHHPGRSFYLLIPKV